MNSCNNCFAETKNPKFCSKRCAAIFNNKEYPKRKVESFCKKCNRPNTKTRSFCNLCWLDILEERKYKYAENITLLEIKNKGNANFGSRYPYIRSLSRAKYKKLVGIMRCKICNYDKHVDICHIKSISSFSEDTLLSEINDLSNLVALCKNHHWEYDNNLLDLEGDYSIL